MRITQSLQKVSAGSLHIPSPMHRTRAWPRVMSKRTVGSCIWNVTVTCLRYTNWTTTDWINLSSTFIQCCEAKSAPRNASSYLGIIALQNFSDLDRYNIHTLSKNGGINTGWNKLSGALVVTTIILVNTHNQSQILHAHSVLGTLKSFFVLFSSLRQQCQQLYC